jgi:maltooligosyltrehalose trehalohydrolase
MGEEYGETAPFQYFVSHSDPKLIEAVREGRQTEFAAFQWTGKIPDPQSESTFEKSKLHHELRRDGGHQVLYELVRELIRLRKALPDASRRSEDAIETAVCESERLLWVKRSGGSGQAIAAFNLGDKPVTARVPFAASSLKRILDSADQRWGGDGSSAPGTLEAGRENFLSIAAKSFVLYHSN